MSVCICVSVSVYEYVYVLVCVLVCVCACVLACACVCTCMHTCMCLRMCVLPNLPNPFLFHIPRSPTPCSVHSHPVHQRSNKFAYSRDCLINQLAVTISAHLCRSIPRFSTAWLVFLSSASATHTENHL